MRHVEAIGREMRTPTNDNRARVGFGNHLDVDEADIGEQCLETIRTGYKPVTDRFAERRIVLDVSQRVQAAANTECRPVRFK